MYWSTTGGQQSEPDPENEPANDLAIFVLVVFMISQLDAGPQKTEQRGFNFSDTCFSPLAADK